MVRHQWCQFQTSHGRTTVSATELPSSNKPNQQRTSIVNNFLTTIVIIVSCGHLFAADLVITGQSNKTFANGTYGHLSISNSNNITIRNCKFVTSYAAGSGGGVADISGSNHITIDSCDFNGDTTTCTGMNVGGSYITIEHCNIHDIADDGFQCGNGDHIYLLHNTICHLYGCGSDGGCGPCYNGHSDGFELSHLDTVVLSGNLVYDVRSTSAVILDNYSGGVTVHNLVLDNNIFYTPETGVIVYIFYGDGIKMYNNTFWKSNWLGISVGPSVTRVEAYNNIVQCIDYTFLSGTYNATDHKYDYNLVGFAGRGLAAQSHDIVTADPKFRRIPIATDNTSAHVYRTVSPADFELLSNSPAIGKGTSGGLIPTVDFYGRPRKAPYDMGAIAYGGSSAAQNPRIRQAASANHGLLRDRMRLFDLHGREHANIVNNRCFVVKGKDNSLAKMIVAP